MAFRPMVQLFSILLVIPYVIDNLSPLWDARHQAWHDKVVNSVVVEVRASSPDISSVAPASPYPISMSRKLP